MAFRFRKSFTLAPGLRLNVGSRGASISALGFNFSSRGVTAGFSIPGTGISYRTNLSIARRAAERAEAARAQLAAREAAAEAAVNERIRRLSTLDVALQDDGSLVVRDGDDGLLSRQDFELCWEVCAKTLADFLASNLDRINREGEGIANIHLDTRDPNAVIEHPIVPFNEPEPAAWREVPFGLPEPVLREPPAPGWFRRKIGFLRRRHEQAVDAARKEYKALFRPGTRRVRHTRNDQLQSAVSAKRCGPHGQRAGEHTLSTSSKPATSTIAASGPT